MDFLLCLCLVQSLLEFPGHEVRLMAEEWGVGNKPITKRREQCALDRHRNMQYPRERLVYRW